MEAIASIPKTSHQLRLWPLDLGEVRPPPRPAPAARPHGSSATSRGSSHRHPIKQSSTCLGCPARSFAKGKTPLLLLRGMPSDSKPKGLSEYAEARTVKIPPFFREFMGILMRLFDLPGDLAAGAAQIAKRRPQESCNHRATDFKT